MTSCAGVYQNATRLTLAGEAECGHLGVVSKFAFDPHELVVLGHAFRPGQRADLDLADVCPDGAPVGMIMYSWKSAEPLACLPPLRTFIIGIGMVNLSVGSGSQSVET